ncbi:MAG: LysR family transcriptional regulator [Deltaproteobacteria bacterium]|jgi:molybdate transport system regulatory protein|nr:LysR family transcriptional regulator [Deltaproteobacteria bacterium]
MTNLIAKIFLASEENYVLGPGRVALLRATESLGSLNKAAQAAGMSYRWAWGRLKDSEKALGVRLLAAKPAAGRGQPKALTPEGQELLDWYAAVESQVAEVLRQIPTPTFVTENLAPISGETKRQKLD